jgi:ATP-dependent helicase HrpB
MTPIPADWLLDGAEVRETLAWVGERVEAREQLCFGALVIEEEVGRGDPAAVAVLLHEHAAPVAHRVFPDHERAEAFVARAAWLRRVGRPVPELSLAELVREGCEGCRSLADLGDVSLLALARVRLGSAASLVDAEAPEFLALPGRAKAPVTYPADADPYVSSRMQDFFGLRASPRAGGRPIVMHLLAPNQRPVQVTSDLAGFWERHYPGIRRELMRRYPRHRWPEDPLRPDADES